MKENVIQEKSFSFAIRIMKTARFLREKKEFEIASQLIRCGTSVGANVEEAIGAQSTKDFNCKMNIAHKESRESHYWIRLLKESDVLEERLADSLISDCEEIMKLTASILKTLKKNQQTNP